MTLTKSINFRRLLEQRSQNSTNDDNFSGVENPRLYSETYSGTKDLVQEYVDEVNACIRLEEDNQQMESDDRVCRQRASPTDVYI